MVYKDTEGMTLIEVLVALFILTTGVSLVVEVFASISSRLKYSKYIQDSMHIAHEWYTTIELMQKTAMTIENLKLQDLTEYEGIEYTCNSREASEQTVKFEGPKEEKNYKLVNFYMIVKVSNNFTYSLPCYTALLPVD